MLHHLISGVTRSGKTTLARAMANIFARKKNPPIILVFDPMGTQTAGDDWPENAFVFDDADKFLNYCENIARHERITRTYDAAKGKNYLLFIDEADNIFSLSQKENNWLLTRGRHYGFTCILICQRPNMVAPNSRKNCAVVCAFRLARSDSKLLGDETGHNDIDKINLDTGDYLVLVSGSSVYTRHNIFNQLRKGMRTWKHT